MAVPAITKAPTPGYQPGNAVLGTLLLPLDFTATFERDDAVVELRIALRPGHSDRDEGMDPSETRPVLQSVTVHRKGADLRSSTVRLPIESLFVDALKAAAWHVESHTSPEVREVYIDSPSDTEHAELARMARRRPHTKGPWKLDDEHLGEVARIYRESVYLGQPVESVAEYFGVPRPTASRWVAKARDRRLLEPPSKGAKP